MWTFRIYTILITLAAAAINFSVLPGRLNEYLPFGIFFLFVGLLQTTLALLTLIKPSKYLFRSALWGTLLLLFLWIFALKVGLPVGPFAGRPEQLTVADALIIFLEVLSAICFGILQWRFSPKKFKYPLLLLLKILPGAIFIGIISFIGVQTGLHSLPFAVNMGAGMGGMTMSGMQMTQEIPMNSLREKPGNEPLKQFTLTTKAVTLHGQTVWTYNGVVPGPELRVTQGDRVKITLINNLPVSTTIHWHGLRLPNAEDGVAGITQDAVPPGGSYTYEFVVKDPGTYWYHSHQETEQQVPRGLYGALIVAPKDAHQQSYDHDYTVTVGDLSDNENKNMVLINGTNGEYHFDAKPGQNIRLRIINAEQGDMTGFPETMKLIGAPYKIIALDGHDINQPQEIGPQLLPLGVGQRYDLVFRMPSSGQVRLLDERAAGASHAVRKAFVSLGTGAVPSETKNGATFDLTHYGAATKDPIFSRSTFDVNQDLRISNGHGFRYGSWENIHMINGKASPDTDPILVKQGQYVHLRFINETDEYHPMHIHGHVFTVLSKNGKRLAGSPIHLDSVLVGPHETWEVAFLADNPGLWMLHCHVLQHAAFGLSTMVNYEGVTTPYVIGTKSGNFPE